jgi:hypothetical protein
MPYEKFERKSVRVDEPSLALTKSGRIRLNAAACRIIEQAGMRSVVILWDAGTCGIALQAAQKGDKNGFLISFSHQRHSATIGAKTFFNHIGWSSTARQNIPASWNAEQKMLEARLPAKYVTRPA